MGRISAIIVTDQPEQRTLSIKTETTMKAMQTEIEACREKILTYLSLLGEFPAGPSFTIYYSFTKQHVDIEVGYPVAKVMPPQDEISMSAISGGKKVSCLHIGPYNEIPKIYQELDTWLEANDYETDGTSCETYYNGEGYAPEEYLTKIELPIQEKDEPE